MRLCADQPDAREGLRDGSLTLSAAAELQWAFDRQRRRGSISGTAAIAPAGTPAPDSVAPAVSLPPAEPEPPPLVLDAVGRRQLVEEAAGKSARQVRQMLADLDPELAPPADRVRPLGDGRYELKAVYRRGVPAGAGAAPGAALARGPAHDAGAARRTPGQGGARPPRPEPAATPSAQRQTARGREGNRPANSDAGAGAREQRSGAADRPGRRPPRRFDAGVAAGGGATRRFDDEGRGDPRRRRSDTGAGGSADTDLRAAAEHPGGDGPPSRYRREADGRPSPPPSRARQVTA